jgi:dTDP-4-amino-4,6-dideoxygalactose transaminase
MKVPFLDLRASYLEVQAELDEAALRVLGSGQYIGGAEVDAFEAEFAEYLGVEHCVTVANGLEALQLGLLAAGVQKGDEVIVPAHTFVATWLAVTHCGAVPVPVDVDPATCNLDASALEAAMTRRTRAVVPVHLYGVPADLDAIAAVCDAHGLAMVEDAAQAHGARYRGRRVGAHGVAVCWSFYPGKNLGAFGDGGAITTADPEVAARLRRLRNYGSPVRYVHDEAGFNSRLDPLQAAFLRVKLSRLDAWNERRQRIARRYLRELPPGAVELPAVPPSVEPVWHLFCVRHPERDQVRHALEAMGVETLIHYPVPPHLQRAYAGMGLQRGTYPVAERIAGTVLSLPIGPAMTDSQVDVVIEAMGAVIAIVESA